LFVNIDAIGINANNNYYIGDKPVGAVALPCILVKKVFKFEP